MIIRNYDLDVADAGLIQVENDLKQLVSTDAMHPSGQPPHLLVWRHAFLRQKLEKAMSSPNWSVDLIEGMQSQEWNWKIETGEGIKSTNSTEISSWTRKAAGVEHPPSGNVAATLSIREYTDRESGLGGFDWWHERLNHITDTDQNGFATNLVNTILDVLSTAASAGSAMFVEQISVLLAKDESAPIASLTPTLHSDQYYGVRESAICSLLERGYNDLGGALFMPKCHMDHLWHMRPIDLAKIMSELPDEPLVVTGSGDVLIFDGMIDLNSNCDAKNGIPHISSEVPGKSARLAILMYHHRKN